MCHELNASNLTELCLPPAAIPGVAPLGLSAVLSWFQSSSREACLQPHHVLAEAAFRAARCGTTTMGRCAVSFADVVKLVIPIGWFMTALAAAAAYVASPLLDSPARTPRWLPAGLAICSGFAAFAVAVEVWWHWRTATCKSPMMSCMVSRSRAWL